MRFILFTLFLLLNSSFVMGQKTDVEWYSETTSNGLVIQNSFPKGGPYPSPIIENFNYSYLVFFSRVLNETENPIELSLNFKANPIAIPDSPDTFMKLFLPTDTMTLAKYSLFSYGITVLESFDQPTSFLKKLDPGEDCLFYVVAIFYQTRASAWSQERGGNRAELVLQGQDLFYRIPPQVDLLPCGQVVFKK